MKAKSQKIGALEKVSFFLANVGNIPLMSLLSSFFTLFYTTIVGLDPAALGTLFLISKVADGISDPIMGYFLDKFPVTKMGKFRPMLILGTVICVINYIFLWFGAVWSPVGKYVIVYITYLLLGWTFDIMDISLNSLLPVMTAENKERNSLSLIKALGYGLGGAAISILAPIIVASGTLESYYILIFGSMAVTLVFSILGALGVKERVTPKGTDDERYSLRELFQFLRFKPVWTHFLTILLSTVGTSLSSGTGTFFYTYIMKDLKLMSGVSVVSLVITLLGMAVAPVLANKLGKKNVFLAGIIVAVGGSLIRFIDVRSLLLIYVGAVFAGIGGGFIGPLAYGIQADNTMYVQYKTGKRAEAAVASLSSFVSKAAQGVAGAIPGYMLAVTGFIGGAAQQPQSVEGGIIFCSITLPLILCAAAGLVFGTLHTREQHRGLLPVLGLVRRTQRRMVAAPGRFLLLRHRALHEELPRGAGGHAGGSRRAASEARGRWLPYGLPDGSHTVVKVKKTYRLEQETIDELEKLCSDSGKSATEVIEGAIHDAIRLPDTERAGEGWAQTVAALTDQLAVKDDQIASLGRALEAAQETAKAAQALHAANVQERALESSEQKERRRWRWPWDRQDG